MEKKEAAKLFCFHTPTILKKKREIRFWKRSQGEKIYQTPLLCPCMRKSLAGWQLKRDHAGSVGHLFKLLQ